MLGIFSLGVASLLSLKACFHLFELLRLLLPEEANPSEGPCAMGSWGHEGLTVWRIRSVLFGDSLKLWRSQSFCRFVTLLWQKGLVVFFFKRFICPKVYQMTYLISSVSAAVHEILVPWFGGFADLPWLEIRNGKGSFQEQTYPWNLRRAKVT